MGKCLRKYCICLPRKKSSEIKVFSILLLGLSNSGKTEIGHRIAGEVRTDFGITNGVRRYSKKDHQSLWNITEIGGSYDMQRIWHYYFVKAMGVIFTIDISDLKSMPNGFKKIRELIQHKFLQNKPFLILLTKTDLNTGAVTVDISDVEQFYDLEQLANRFKCPMLLEECGKNDDGIGFESGLDWLDSIIASNYKNLRNRIKFDSSVVQSSVASSHDIENLPERPKSAPSLRHMRIKNVKSRPRLIHIRQRMDSFQQNGPAKMPKNKKDFDNAKLNAITVDNETETHSAGGRKQSQEFFGQKIESKYFKSNKVADINSNHKIGLVQVHI